MATIARGTPSFALPATQNTAPVHEFKCLYTHDIRKKAKKWHDGSARFHTFNKRVMVYDDTKSYIGDLHYRADEEFGEGVELQLDRGVLVEVGERVGQTHTDLTGIINRPHADASSPSTATATTQSRPVQRINAVTSQGRPKSLSELLGPSQGRTGRARLPLQSPFEQRHGPAQIQHDEPQSKRQKISLGKENEHPLTGCSDPHVAIDAPVQTRRTTVRPTTQLQHESFASVRLPNILTDVIENVIDISSDEEIQVRPRKTQPQSKKGGKPNRPIPNEQSKTRLRPTENVSIPTSNDGRQSITKSKSVGQHGEILSSGPKSSATSSTPTGMASNSSRPKTSQLRMVSQKPRRKLMYKALLPANMREQDPHHSPKAPAKAVDRSIDASIIAQSSACASDDVVDDGPGLDEFGGLTASPELPDLPPETLATPQQCSEKRVDPHSPLFVSQSPSRQTPLKSQPFGHDNFGIPATQEFLAPANESREDNVDNNMDININDDVDVPDSPCFPQPPHLSENIVRASPSLQPRMGDSVDEVTTLEDPPLRSDHTEQPLPNPLPVASRPLARSLSENDGIEGYDSPPSLSRASVSLPKPADQIRALPRPNLPPPVNHVNGHGTIRSPIQHSLSDTAAIIPHAIASPPPPPVSNEQGPWTKIEAFLLFNKWPHCKAKDKPVFEKVQESGLDGDSDGDDNGVNSMPTNKAFHPVIIRSARHVLRDEY